MPSSWSAAIPNWRAEQRPAARRVALVLTPLELITIAALVPPPQGERCAVTRPGTAPRRVRVPGLKLFDRLSPSVDGVSEV